MPASARCGCAIDIGIEIHAHNDLGLATANTLAAVLAGATHASTTVNGLGERAGNAALEEVVMGLRHLYDLDCGVDTTRLPAISALVAHASGRPVAAGKSIVGSGVFTHESGIHVDGLLKDRRNYEHIAPGRTGAPPPPGAGQALGFGRRGQRLRAAGPDAVGPPGRAAAGGHSPIRHPGQARTHRRRAAALLPGTPRFHCLGLPAGATA